MALKYKVMQNNFVFGNYPGKSAEIAVDKAIAAHSNYKNIDYSIPFTVVRGLETFTIKREG